MVDASTLQEALETFPEVELAVLFGSAARGGARPDSDVDVGVRLTRDPAALHRVGNGAHEVAELQKRRRTPRVAAPPVHPRDAPSSIPAVARNEAHASLRRAKIERALVSAVRRPVDLIELDEAPPLLRFEIATHGILLIETRPYAWADFRYRAMQDWWEFAPIARRFQRAAIRRIREELRGTH